MRKGNVLQVVIVLIFLFLVAAPVRSFASGNGKPGSDSLNSINFNEEAMFLQEYSKILGYPVDTFCNRALITTVADWLGTPYRHAGFSKKGIDCSGFVSKMYQEVFGINLTHSSSAMIYQMKERVKKSELQEGDILFFRIHGKRISHVGLYLGDNKFVHASINRGIVVDDLRSAYYARAYYTAGRPGVPSQIEETLNSIAVE